MDLRNEKRRKKIDLHCHLDGSIPVGTFIKLAKDSDIELPQICDIEFLKISAPKDCQSLKQYLECFDLPGKCLQTKTHLYEAAKSEILAAAQDDVVYIELRFAPLLHTLHGLKVPEILESVISGVRDGCAEVKATGHYIEGNVIVCGMRHEPVEKNAKMLKECADFIGHGLCGVDIAGNEADFPPMTQKALFDLAKDLKLPATIHAGECGSVSNVLDAAALGARRIGHGIALAKDAKARQYCRGNGIFLELCPTSNLQTKAVLQWSDYPFRLFMTEGLGVTVNTDNRTVSQTTMREEYELLRRHCGMTPEDEAMIYQNSIAAAFADDHVKNKLLKYVI